MAPLVVVGPPFERSLDVGQLARLVRAVDLGEDVLGDAQLVEGWDLAVEHDSRTSADRLVPVLLERRRQHRCEEKRFENTPAWRAASVHPLWTT